MPRLPLVVRRPPGAAGERLRHSLPEQLDRQPLVLEHELTPHRSGGDLAVVTGQELDAILQMGQC